MIHVIDDSKNEKRDFTFSRYLTIYFRWRNFRKNNKAIRFLMESVEVTVDYKSLSKNVENQIPKNQQFNNIVDQSLT